MCFVCQRFYGLGIGRFLHVQSVCQRFWYQKVSSGPVFFSFCGFTVCFREFLQVLYVFQSLGVRAVLQILLSGVSEVSRFKCQRISLGSVFQFEVWVSNDFKV